MIKFSKICATALALAMSVTFVTPTTALAAKKVSTETELGRVGSDTESLNTDVKVVGTYTGETSGDAQAKMVAAGLAGGWLKTTESSDFDNEVEFYNGTVWEDYYYPDGYTFDDDYGMTGTYPDGKYQCTWTVKLTEYVNASTGKRSTKKSEAYTNDEAAQQKFVSGIRIKNGETTYLAVPLRNGDVNIKNVKSSKKKIVKAKRFTKKDSVNLSNDNLDFHRYDGSGLKSEVVNGKTVYYFYTSAGEKVVLADDYEKDAKYLTTTDSSATVYIKLTPGKTGKSKLSFDIVNDQGVVTGKVSTTVYVMNDITALKTFTFGGKSLLNDYSNTKNFNYGKRASDTLYNVSTASSGKLVVKANSTYKIVKIEVGKLYTEALSSEDIDSDFNYSYSYSASGKTVYHKVDLNGDGDTDDIVGGISESEVTYKYSKVRSGKKIKLSTVGWDQASVREFKARTDSAGKNPTQSNEAGAAVTQKQTDNAYNLYAPTHIKVTVYDKLNKEYSTIDRTIYRVVKK